MDDLVLQDINLWIFSIGYHPYKLIWNVQVVTLGLLCIWWKVDTYIIESKSFSIFLQRQLSKLSLYNFRVKITKWIYKTKTLTAMLNYHKLCFKFFSMTTCQMKLERIKNRHCELKTKSRSRRYVCNVSPEWRFQIPI